MSENVCRCGHLWAPANQGETVMLQRELLADAELIEHLTQENAALKDNLAGCVEAMKFLDEYLMDSEKNDLGNCYKEFKQAIALAEGKR